MDLIKLEAGMCRTITGIFLPFLVVHLALLNVLIRTFRREIKSGSRLSVNTNINTSSFMVRKSESKINCIPGNFSGEAHGRTFTFEFDIGLFASFNRRRVEHVVDSLALVKRDDVCAVKPATLGLVTGIGERGPVGRVVTGSDGSVTAQ